jgi:uncharacterized protein YqeY
MDALGKLCADGKATAEYLWQVPKDEAARAKIASIIRDIATESGKQGRKEMGRICEELMTAVDATPSPQQVDLLVDGFDRLTKLWQAAKSGLL